MAFSGSCSFVMLLGLISVALSQTCQKLDHRQAVCITDNRATLTCPVSFWMKIKSATAHWKVQGSTICPPPDGTTGCETADITSQMKSICDGRENSCTYSVVPPTTTSCGQQGRDFIDVVFRCAPRYNSYDYMPVALGDPSPLSLTQTAIIGNAPQERHRSCRLSFPAGTQVELDPHLLSQYNLLATSGPCDQKFVIWDVSSDSVIHEFCFGDPGQVVVLACNSEPKQLLTQFVTTNPNQDVTLQFFVRVADNKKFNIDCSQTHVFPTTALPTTQPPTTTAQPPVTTTRLPTTTRNPGGFNNPETTTTTTSKRPTTPRDSGDFTPSTETSDEEMTTSAEGTDAKKGLNWKLIIILICCAVALLLLIIAVLIVLIRHKRDMDKAENISDQNSNRSSAFTYVTELYIEGDQRAKLMMDGTKSPMPRQSIQT